MKRQSLQNKSVWAVVLSVVMIAAMGGLASAAAPPACDLDDPTTKATQKEKQTAADKFVEKYYSATLPDDFFDCNPGAPTDNNQFYLLSWALFLNAVYMADNQTPAFENWPTAEEPFCNLVGDASCNRTSVDKELRNAKVDAIEQTGPPDILVDEKTLLTFYSIAVNSTYGDFISNGDFIVRGTGDFTCENGTPTYYDLLKRKECYQNADKDFAPPRDFGTTFTLKSFPIGAMELKMSWRVVNDCSAFTDFYTIGDQNVAGLLFDSSNKTVNTASTSSSLTLALTGMHLVWTQANFPAFIWSTFTQKDTYQEDCPTDTSGYNTATYTQDANLTTTTPCTKTTTTTTPCVQTVAPNETNVFTETTKVCRKNPYGFPSGSTAADIAFINQINSLIMGSSILPAPWNNYEVYGSVWAKPTPNPLPTQAQIPGALAGGTLLANMTMETFTQMTTGSDSCFSCHNIAGKSSGKIKNYKSGYMSPSSTSPDLNLDLSHMFNKYKTILKEKGPKKKGPD